MFTKAKAVDTNKITISQIYNAAKNNTNARSAAIDLSIKLPVFKCLMILLGENFSHMHIMNAGDVQNKWGKQYNLPLRFTLNDLEKTSLSDIHNIILNGPINHSRLASMLYVDENTLEEYLTKYDLTISALRKMTQNDVFNKFHNNYYRPSFKIPKSPLAKEIINIADQKTDGLITTQALLSTEQINQTNKKDFQEYIDASEMDLDELSPTNLSFEYHPVSETKEANELNTTQSNEISVNIFTNNNNNISDEKHYDTVFSTAPHLLVPSNQNADEHNSNKHPEAPEIDLDELLPADLISETNTISETTEDKELNATELMGSILEDLSASRPLPTNDEIMMFSQQLVDEHNQKSIDEISSPIFPSTPHSSEQIYRSLAIDRKHFLRDNSEQSNKRIRNEIIPAHCDINCNAENDIEITAPTDDNDCDFWITSPQTPFKTW